MLTLVLSLLGLLPVYVDNQQDSLQLPEQYGVGLTIGFEQLFQVLNYCINISCLINNSPTVFKHPRNVSLWAS